MVPAAATFVDLAVVVALETGPEPLSGVMRKRAGRGGFPKQAVVVMLDRMPKFMGDGIRGRVLVEVDLRPRLPREAFREAAPGISGAS